MSNGILTGDDGFGFSVESPAVESEDQLYAGNQPNKEGWAHVSVQQVSKSEERDDKLLCIELKCEVHKMSHLTKGAAETFDDQIGKSFTHRVWIESWQDKGKTVKGKIDEKGGLRIKALFYAFGLLDEAGLKNPQLNVNFGALQGRQAIGKVTKSEDQTVTDKDGNTQVYKGRYEVQWTNEFYRIGSEVVKDVATDGNLLQLGGISTGGNSAASLI